MSYTRPSSKHESGKKEEFPIKSFVWGLNDKDQLGGLKGSKIKLPVFSDVLSSLNPVSIAGGSKSLFLVTNEGKVFACGEGTNGRLGLGHCNNVPCPRQLTTISQYVVKKVAVHSGGKVRTLMTGETITTNICAARHGADSGRASVLLGGGRGRQAGPLLQALHRQAAAH